VENQILETFGLIVVALIRYEKVFSYVLRFWRQQAMVGYRLYWSFITRVYWVNGISWVV
jgi:hypothetical protein